MDIVSCVATIVASVYDYHVLVDVNMLYVANNVCN